MKPVNRSIVAIAPEKGLEPVLLYEGVIELADEGLFTATCLNAAAGILLTALGLPQYFFRNLSKDALKRLLRAIAGNLQFQDGQFVLRSEVSEAHFDVEGGVQVRIATPANRDRMEAVLEPVMTGHRIEYYFGRGACRASRSAMIKTDSETGSCSKTALKQVEAEGICSKHTNPYAVLPLSGCRNNRQKAQKSKPGSLIEHSYYTYIIRPETCPAAAEAKPGGSPFAFSRIIAGPPVPEPTRVRYEEFLAAGQRSVIPLVASSAAAVSGETRIMFKDDFSRSALPVIRRMLEDLGLMLNRAYWETYREATGRIESICSLYLAGTPPAARLRQAEIQLQGLLTIQAGDLDDLYVQGILSFSEYQFSIVASAFVHTFISKGLGTDRDIMEGLERQELRDAMAHRIFNSNRAEYTRQGIIETIRRQPVLLQRLYRLYDNRFNPAQRRRLTPRALARELDAFRRDAAILLVDDRTSFDIVMFMTRLITHVRKTNFYKTPKRSCAFRLDPAVMDPLVFPSRIHGLFFVVGFYAIATHMRAADIARGGVRLIRVTAGNYENELDNMPLLNYALGPVAQRLKHKDIAESGAKGVIVPGIDYARDGLNAMFDFSEGILDLVQPNPAVVDYLGQPEMLFFGPDEGTAGFMDAVALRARERGYRYWRTITTGKSIGIPHDTYGLTRDGHVFGLLPREGRGTELQLDGKPVLITPDPARIVKAIGSRIDNSGMTTIGVLACLRVLLEAVGLKEENVNLMMSGGPDGDLGANQIQSFKGRICLIIDGGSVLFDPDGLDHTELLKLAVARHTEPRLNSLAYPEAKLGPHGFKIPRQPGSFRLPDGTTVADGAFFHREFLFNPALRHLIAKANLQAFVPCGGFKDTINADNVRAFLKLFTELKVIVEGANVFFDDTAREVIARESKILQIRDSSANKGGVTCSAIAEVLPAFLLGEAYEKVLVDDPKAKADLVRAIFARITANAVAETRMLLALHRKSGTPLYRLSVTTSEQLMAFQEKLVPLLPHLLRHQAMVDTVLKAYIPEMLLKRVGWAKVRRLFAQPELLAYRDAILTKTLAARAVYRHAAGWDEFQKQMDADPRGTLAALCAGE